MYFPKKNLKNIKVSLLPETLQITDLTNESPEEHKLSNFLGTVRIHFIDRIREY